MKKFFYLAVAALSLSLAGCYNDDDVWDAINGQEERIAALETWQKTANENIAALQAIVNGNDYIKSVTHVTENGETIGYTISFLRQGDVTIYHGTDGEKGNKGDKGDKGDTGATGVQGEKGDTPVIGVVKQDDGLWYWTLNGELLKDADGNAICASGKDGQDGSNGSSGSSAPIPQLKTGSELGSDYEANAIYMSVNGGNTWTKVSGRNGTNGKNFFSKEPEEGAYSWTFTLADGTSIVIPKYANLALFYSVGDNEVLIENATLSVKLHEEFSIICKPEEGCNWTYEEEKPGLWEIEEAGNELKFSGVNTAGSNTILFTLTTKDNQVFFYQVTVTAQNSMGTIQAEDNPELAVALADMLQGMPGVTTDESGNLEIPVEIIESQTELNLSNRKLKSLEGLEIFSKLENLDCSNNELAVLDLSAWESLRILHCENCLSQPAVVSKSLIDGVLDMSGNPELEELYCGNNRLTGLILSGNKNLTILNCDNNLLSSLNLNANPHISSLYCQNNKLSTLNVSLQTVLKDLECGMQQNASPLVLTLNEDQKSTWESTWKTLENNANVILAAPEKTITNLALITRIENQHNVSFTRNADGNVNVEENKAILESITDLNMSYANEIESLQGIEHLTNLETVWCSFSNITTLDVSQNTKLKKLEITFPNGLKDVKLGNLPELKILEFTSSTTDKILTEELDLSGCPNLQSLFLSGTNLTTLDVSHCSQLTYLACYYSQLTTLDIRNNKELTTLYCYGNNLKTLDITQNPLLEKLKCGKQNNDSNLELTLSEEQKATWENTWKATEENANVVLAGTENNTFSPNIGIEDLPTEEW